MATGYGTNNKFSSYQTDDNAFENFIVSEVRMRLAQYADPISLCFKFMPDFEKPYGLLADEKNVNSALAYLKRIGETGRYLLLKRWIEIFKQFTKQYDFLILECDGLDEIIGKQIHEFFTEQDKIILKVRETSDMLCQSLISMYRLVAFCESRKVEVLPANLRRFDFGILVFSSGYYNMSLYDILGNNGLSENDVETQMFPTLKKLSDKYFVDNADNYPFNFNMFAFGDAQISIPDSGKTFVETMTNEPSGEYVKNSLGFNFRFATYRGMYNNLFGSYDYSKSLAISAAQDRISNELTNSAKANSNLNNLSTFKNKDIAQNDAIKSKINSVKNKILSKNTFLGQAIDNFGNPEYYKQMAANTVNKLETDLENKLINDPLARLNNLVSTAFADNFADLFGNTFGDKNKNRATTFENESNKNIVQKPTNSIDYQENISQYTRKGF